MGQRKHKEVECVPRVKISVEKLSLVPSFGIQKRFSCTVHATSHAGAEEEKGKRRATLVHATWWPGLPVIVRSFFFTSGNTNTIF